MFKFIVTFIKKFKHACNVSKRANMLPCMFVLLVISAFLVSISAI